MKPNVLFIGWNEAKNGREGMAMELFSKTQTWYDKLQADGRIESHETFLLSRHGGDLNGFSVLRGEPGKLAELRYSEEMLDVIVEASLCIDGFGVIESYNGESLMAVMSKWGKTATKARGQQ